MRSSPLWNRLALAALAFGLLPATSALAEYRNGARFDPGREMTARAEGAPVELDRVTGFVGQWDVEIVRPQSEEEDVKAAGKAEITFMNRGHGLMENFFSESVDGHFEGKVLLFSDVRRQTTATSPDLRVRRLHCRLQSIAAKCGTTVSFLS